MTKELLRESTLFDYKEEDIVRKDGTLFLKGIIQKADTKNHNGRIYPYAVLKRAVEDYQLLISERRSTGEANHPSNSISVDIDRISHVVTKLWMEGNNVMGIIEIIETLPCGANVKNLIDKKIKIGISSRGLGSVERHGDNLVVQDFQIICWDIVTDPSTPGAWLSRMDEACKQQKLLSESVKQEAIKKPHLKQSDRLNTIANDILSIKGKK